MATKKELLVEINAKIDGLKKGIKQSEKEARGFGKTISKLGGLIAGAFAVSRVTAFANEVSQLAGEAEGVSNAFDRIADKGILEDLQKATRGTVSDLELMKRTVMASNFQLPVEQLASLFEFASRRAQETGQSVDYLVNSIVLGIGRKSPLILDNLGISAIRLKKELKGAGVELTSVADVASAVGKIATEEMSKMGESIVTSTDKTAQFNTEWQNVKVEIGEVVNVVRDELNEELTESLGLVKQIIRFRKNILLAVIAEGKEQDGLNEKALENYTWWEKIKLGVGAVRTALSKTNEVLDDYVTKLEGGDKDPVETLNNQTEEIEDQTKAVEYLTGAYDSFAQAEWDAKQQGIERGKEARKEMEALTEAALQKEKENEQRIADLNAAKKAQEEWGQITANTYFDAMRAGETYADGMRNVISTVIGSLIAKGIAAIVSKVFEKTPNPWLALALAGAAGAAAGAIFKAVVPSYAEGTVTSGPQLAMIGDNPSGREFIIPSEKMGSFLQMNTKQRVHVTGTLRGDGRSLIATIDETNRYTDQIY